MCSARYAVRMRLPDLCWLCTLAYALHVLEEFAFDWKGWARAVLRLPVEWSTFYVTNAAVIVAGIVCAELAPQEPVLALALPALMLINAVFFHLLPFLLTRGRFSPGLFTAVTLFFPLGIAAFRRAHTAGLATVSGLCEAMALGLLLMAAPILFLKLSTRPYFQQRDPDAAIPAPTVVSS